MKEITVEELKAKLDAKEDFVFIDVREPHEYDVFNLGARLIPLEEFLKDVHILDDNKGDEIVIHCRSGMRSSMAVEALVNSGYTNVRNLVGGVLRWQEVFPG